MLLVVEQDEPGAGEVGIGNTDAPLRADRLQPHVIGREAGGEGRSHAAREMQQAGEPDVHPARAQDLLSLDAIGLLTGDETRTADAVAADVHERPAVELARQPYILEGCR